MGGDGLVDRAVQLCQRGGHLLGLGFPQPRRALDVGQQQRHRSGRQQLTQAQLAPGQRWHLRVLAHGSQHRRPDAHYIRETAQIPRAARVDSRQDASSGPRFQSNHWNRARCLLLVLDIAVGVVLVDELPQSRIVETVG